jgi:flagellar biosynthesis GTPase FlhF
VLGGGCRFVTGGTDAGIMKLVGEAKAKYNPHAPLIGIAPFGAVADRSHNQWLKHGAEICYNEVMATDNLKDSAALDQHHSHFVLVDDDDDASSSSSSTDADSAALVDRRQKKKSAFGCERPLRASLEQCVASSLDPGYPVYTLQGFPSGHEYAKYEKKRVLDIMDVHHLTVPHERQGERDVIVMVMSAETPGTAVYIKCKVKNLRRISADEEKNQMHLAARNDLERREQERKEQKRKEQEQEEEEEQEEEQEEQQEEQKEQEEEEESNAEEPSNSPVPLVSICVSGGPGSIETALKTVQTGTASLLVRGSGKAADLLSDVVLLRYTPRHPAHIKYRSPLQDALWHFFVLCGFRPDEENDTQVLSFDVVIAAIQQEINAIQQELSILKQDGVQRYSGTQVSQILTHPDLRYASEALVTLAEPRGYQVQTVFDDGKCKPSEEDDDDAFYLSLQKQKSFLQKQKQCLTILLQAVQSGEFALCAR